MATAGTLVYNTKLDTSGIDRGLKGMTNSVRGTGSTIKSILGGLGIASIVSKGINMISSSLDGAITRFDIMNNFPKVMSNLGISSKDAQESVDIMSEKLMGLPTTLDEATLAVQRFTSANGDVKKSTDIFLAVNNAILAGGASATVQSAALEQLSQAYAKGKPDMIEWRTLMTAMPAQLTQVAKAMGYVKTADLGEAVKAKGGEKEFRRMIDTIMKLNKKGMNGFASLEEQARASTSGIQTAMKNMRSRTVQGVTAVIEAFNKLLKKTKFKNIAGLLEGIGNFFRDNLKKMAKAISKLPLDKFLNAFNKLKPIIGSVVTGLLAMGGAIKIMKIGSLVKDVIAFVAALSPITLAVGAVAALGTAIYIYSKKAKEGTKATEENKKALQDYTSSMKEAKNAKEEYLDENLGEVQRYEDLKTELDGLIDKNGKVKKGYEDRASFIISTLNEALGTEMKMTDGIISNYDDLSESIQKVIDKKKAQIILEAHEKEYAEAVKQKSNLEKAYTSELAENERISNKYLDTLMKISKQTGYSTSELDEQIEKYGMFDTRMIKNRSERMKLTEEVLKYNHSLKESNKTLEDAKNKYTNNEYVMKRFEDATVQMRKNNTEAVMKIYDDTRNYTGKTTQEIYNDYQKRINQQSDYLTSLILNKENYDSKFVESEKTKTQKTIENLKKEQAQYKQNTNMTQKDIKGIWNKGMADLTKDLTGKRVTFKQVGKDNFQMYIDGIAEGKPMSKKKAKEVTKAITDEIKKGKSEGKVAGKNIVTGVEDGINYKKGDAFSTVASFGRSLLDKLKASLKEHSPSKATFEMGQFLTQGIVNGINSTKEKAYKTMDNLGKNIINRLKNKLDGIKEIKNNLQNNLTRVDLYSNGGITDLSIVKNQVKQYGDNLKKLKNKLPKGLYTEILGMDREEGLEYTSELLKMNTSDFKQYVSDWKQIQKSSSRISDQYYKSESRKVKEDYVNNLSKEFGQVKKKMGSLGKNAIQGLIDGMKSQSKKLSGSTKTLSQQVINGFKKSLKIKSPSRVIRDEIGKQISEGLAIGIDDNTKDIYKAIDDVNTEIVDRLQKAVNIETGKLTANASIKGNSFVNTIQVDNKIDAPVYMDARKVGQMVTPVVSQTLRKAGVN